MASRPRTITVRVRTLLAAAAVVLTGTLVWWGLGYPTGMQPLSTGTGTTALHGLRVAAKTPAALGPGPAASARHPGGSYVITVQIHNSAAVGPDAYGIVRRPALHDARRLSRHPGRPPG